MGVHLTKKTTKPYRWIARTLPKTLRVILHIRSRQATFPCLLFKIHSGGAYITLIFSKGSSGSNFYNTLPTAPFIQTLELDKRRCILSEIGPERALFISNCYNIINCCSFQNSGLDVMMTIPRYPK